MRYQSLFVSRSDAEPFQVGQWNVRALGVPCFPPRADRSIKRVRRINHNCAAPLCLVTVPGQRREQAPIEPQELGVGLDTLAAFWKLVTCKCLIVLSDDPCLAPRSAICVSSSS